MQADTNVARPMRVLACRRHAAPAVHRHAGRHSVVTFSFSPKYELHLSTVSDSFSKLVAGAMLANIVQQADAERWAQGLQV